MTISPATNRSKLSATTDKLFEIIYSEGLEMKTISYSQARENIAETMDKVCDAHHSPIIVTPKKPALCCDDLS